MPVRVRGARGFFKLTGCAVCGRKTKVTRPVAPAKTLARLLVAVGFTSMLAFPAAASPPARSGQPGLRLEKEFPATSTFAPLERVALEVQPPSANLRVVVKDARGRVYFDQHNLRPGTRFAIEGALGMHSVELLRGSQKVFSATLDVQARTRFDCADPLFCQELTRLAAQIAGFGGVAFIDGRPIRYFSTDVRESRYATSAGRYFEDNLTALPSLFLERQKPNGLVFSSVHADNKYDPYSGTYPGVHLARDTYGEGYTDRSADGRWVFERLPTQADVESMMVAWVHDAWQATGDDGWMARWLPALAKGLNYLQQDPLRWSNELGLVKRAFTLDVWSIQHPLVAQLHPRGSVNRAGWFDGLWIDKDSPMGITHGDNTSFYEAATLMARMHAHLGADTDAAKWTAVAERVRENLNKVSWNGTFFRHHVRLTDNDLWKEMAANEARQLSMSNALAITRGAATHAQAVAIIGEYQHRWEKQKGRVLAEWSSMDPPFRPNFGPISAGSGPNGGITPLVAGPLALAAFEHGAEDYGADIIRRLLSLQRKHGHLSGFYHPARKPESWQPETFQTVDLRTVANRHLRGDKPAGFIDHPDNDLRSFPVGRQTFLGKPFDVVDPKDNGGRSAVILWGAGSPGPRETTVAGIGKKAKSIYFLHSAGNTARQARVGEYVINYSDGSKVRIPLVVGRNIASWWAEGDSGEWRVAWRGKNPHVSVITMGVWGWDNKQPDKTIDSITIRASGLGRVQLLGVTLSDAPVAYEWDEEGAPSSEPWAAGVAFTAATQGLAGVVDRGRSFDHVELSPRWLAANESRASVTLRYPASQGYVAYRFEHQPGDRRVTMAFSGSGSRFDFHVLMPSGQKPQAVTLDGKSLRFRTRTIEGSTYADFSLEAVQAGQLAIGYGKGR